MTIDVCLELLASLEDVPWLTVGEGAIRAPTGTFLRNGVEHRNCPLGVLARVDGITTETEGLAEKTGLSVEDASKLIDAADVCPPIVWEVPQPFDPKLRARLLKAVGLDEMPKTQLRRRWRRFAIVAGWPRGTPAHDAFVKLSMGEPLTREAEIVAVADHWPTVRTYRGVLIE